MCSFWQSAGISGCALALGCVVAAQAVGQESTPTRVEVVRGPNSALYGSGALGGVMAFRTTDASDLLSPGQTSGARVSLGYQGVDNEFLRAATGFTHVGSFDFIGSIGQRTAGDIKLGSGADLAGRSRKSIR